MSKKPIQNPATELVKGLENEIERAHLKTLSHLINLSVPVVGATAKSASLDAAIEKVLTHGETTMFFGQVLSLFQKGLLTREELDQRMINWLIKIPELKGKFDELPENVRACVDQFKDADLSQEDHVLVAEGFKCPPTAATAKKIEKLRTAWEKQFNEDNGMKYETIVEKNGDKVMYVNEFAFENWGETVKNTPAVTFIPKSVVGVQNIVKYAKEVGKKVRVAGYRHTWEDLFSSNDEILISLLPLDIAIDLPSVEGKFSPGEGLLQLIQPLPETVSNGKILCKVGAATTTEQLREWCILNNWAVPVDVVIVETTYGGTISAICHGGGITHQTLSDLVAEVEFVDPNGELRTVSDPELLKAAAGALGMMGVVTAYTIRLDKMTYAAMRPARVPVELAVPPPQEYIDAARKGDPKYKRIKDLVAQHSQETIDNATNEFIHHCENDYFSEWIWFPLAGDVWVNAWPNDGVESQSKSLPTNFQIFLQWVEGWLAELVLNWAVMQALPGELQAKLFAFVTLVQIPDVKPGDPTLTTQLTNGLHFRRGLQNMQFYDMEWFLRIPPKKSPTATTSESPAQRDWTITQKAWWDGILLMEENPSAIRIALEMRIMSGSNILLAPQRGNTLGTTCIEYITTFNTPLDDWVDMCQKIRDKWSSYKDPTTGDRLHARPHWAKQWSFLSLPDDKGLPLIGTQWARAVYKKEISLFMDALNTIGQAAGFTVDDLRARFGNKYVDSIFWGGPDPIVLMRQSDNISRRIINKIKKWIKGCFS